MMDLQQIYVFNQTEGAVTNPTGGSWLSAYCLYLGVTEPTGGTWLTALCIHFGITAPLHGSWLIALADYYGITEPLNGTWWYPLSQLGPPTPTDLIWNTTATEWQLETSTWN